MVEDKVTDHADTCLLLKESLKKVFECLAANDITDYQRVKITYKLLELLKHSCNCLVASESMELPDIDVLGKLLVSISQCRGKETIDLFGCFFAFCCIYGSMNRYVRLFLDSLFSRKEMSELMEKMCRCQEDNEGSPGFYTVTTYLDMFDTIDTNLLDFLNLNLGMVLRTYWVPAWRRWMEMETEIDDKSLKLLIIKENLLLKSLNEAELDFWICRLQHHNSILLNRENTKVHSVRYFLFKIAKRSVKFQDKLISEYAEFVRDFITENLDNDSFHRLIQSENFFYQVIMEVLDHPELNFYEEPHLTNLLRVSLTYFWDDCVRKRNIHHVHYILGNLGTTMCLPSILSSLQYRISKFLLSTMECVQNGDNINENIQWFKRLTDISLPTWFDDFQSKIPPISKSLFSFDNNKTELEQETYFYEECIINLLTSLQLTMNISECVFQFYTHSNLDILNITEKECSFQSCKVQKKANAEFFNMCFVPLLSTMLLSEQLTSKDLGRTLISRSTCSVNAKILFQNCLRNVELVLQSEGNAALYYLIKFLSQVSLESICLQRQSIRLLNHLFFHGSEQFALQICLSNELTTQTLYEYIQLWNDGSPIYSDFFVKVFKRPQPVVEIKKVNIDELVKLLPGYFLKESQNPLVKPQQKFNLNAISFIPGENSNSNELTGPKERSGILTSEFNRSDLMGMKAINSASTNNNSIMDPSKNSYSTMSFRSQFEAWAPYSSVLIQTNSQNSAEKVVNTGKSYILGGHNRVGNNSRTKSVHVDDFERL